MSIHTHKLAHDHHIRREYHALHEGWDFLDIKLSAQLLAAKHALIHILQHSSRSISHLLLTGYEGSYHSAPVPTYSKGSVNKLVDDIFAENTLHFNEAPNLITILAFLIERGNQYHLWNIPLPAVSITVKREKNPFQPDIFRDYLRKKAWIHVVVESLQQQRPLSEQAKVGRVLLSAMTRGGLLNNPSITAFLQHLHLPLLSINHVSFINFSLRWSGQDDQEKRRWFPDALTQILLLQIKKETPLEHKPMAYIHTFFNEVGMDRSQQPKSTTQLIDIISMHMQLYIPPFLVDYARRGCVSHSLKESVWLRLQGLHQKQKVSVENKIQTPDVLPEIETSEVFEAIWITKIKKALRQPSLRSAAKALRDDGHHCCPSPIAQHMHGWVIHMLNKGSRIGRPLALSTIRGYVTRVITNMVDLVENLDMILFDVGAFEEIYEMALEQAQSRDLLQHLARALLEFHHYLHTNYEVPKLESSLLNIAHGLSPVDANILSLDEYEKTIDFIKHGDLNLTHPDLPLVAELLFILGFRCGLRRSEVLKLRLIDFHGTVDPEILVRPHALRRLKTKNAVRKILLSCLLEQAELDALLNWVGKRRQQESQHPYSAYIFSIPDKPYAFVPDEVVFPAIHQAMRTVTGDQNLRYHHLRHSCASWTLLRLMIADFGMPAHFFDALPKTKKWLEKSKQFSHAWYLHNEPTRKHLYSITTLLGHSSPNMSLQHYIHCCDIMLHHVLSQASTKVDVSIWLQLTGIPQTSIYRALELGGEAALIKVFTQHHPQHITTLKPSVIPHLHSENTKSDIVYLEIMRTWKLLYLHTKYQVSIEDIADKYGFTLSEAQQRIKHAEFLADIKSSGRHFRHLSMVEGKSKQRLACPRKPIGVADIKLAKSFASKMNRLQQAKPQHYQWLLDYYLDNAWRKNTDLIFRDLDQAQKYLYILSALKITQPNIVLTWYHGKSIPNVSDVSRKKYWRLGLNLTKNRVLKTKKLNNTRPLGQFGWLGIRLLDYESTKNLDGKATYAFRFVLLMLSILKDNHT